MLIFLSCKNYVVRQTLALMYDISSHQFLGNLVSKCDASTDISTQCLKPLSVTGNIQSMDTFQVHGVLLMVLAFLFSDNIFRLSIQTLRCWQYRESVELGQLLRVWRLCDYFEISTRLKQCAVCLLIYLYLNRI